MGAQTTGLAPPKPGTDRATLRGRGDLCGTGWRGQTLRPFFGVGCKPVRDDLTA
jgi:hypothetical protein